MVSHPAALAAWMTKVSREVTDSALVKALYDLAIAYPAGDETKPAMEAGSMLLTVLRMGAERAWIRWGMAGGYGGPPWSPGCTCTQE